MDRGGRKHCTAYIYSILNLTLTRVITTLWVVLHKEMYSKHFSHKKIKDVSNVQFGHQHSQKVSRTTSSRNQTALTTMNVSAGSGETKCRVGGSGSECWKDAGLEPGGAGTGRGRGPTYHRGAGRQNLRPEWPETEPGKTHRQIAAAAVWLHLHSQRWFPPFGLDLCFTDATTQEKSAVWRKIYRSLPSKIFFLRSVQITDTYEKPLKGVNVQNKASVLYIIVTIMLQHWYKTINSMLWLTLSTCFSITITISSVSQTSTQLQRIKWFFHQVLISYTICHQWRFDHRKQYSVLLSVWPDDSQRHMQIRSC